MPQIGEFTPAFLKFLWFRSFLSCSGEVGCTLNTGSSISVGYQMYRRTSSPDSGVNRALALPFLINLGRKEGRTSTARMALSSQRCSCPGARCMSIYLLPNTKSFPSVVIFFIVDFHPVLHCHPLACSHFFVSSSLFVQSCLRALPLSRPLRLLPESVLVALARVAIRAILALRSLMTLLTCQLNQLTD
jgi:hypothetical protein